MKTHYSLRLVLLALSLGSGLAQDGLKMGDPGCDASLKDREFADRKFYQLCHSYDLKEPLWVGYVLTKADLDGPAERPSGFKQDTLLAHPGAKDSDYSGSGYARGHMAPAEDFSRSDDAIKSTFVLSNVVPQLQSVNGGKWSQLEFMVRKLVRQSGEAYIFTGPIFDRSEVDTVEDGEVGIPTHTFKVILTIGPGDVKKMYAVIMPNANTVNKPLNTYVTTVRAVENKTGFDFFSNLGAAEQNKLETAKTLFPETSPKKKAKPAKNKK